MDRLDAPDATQKRYTLGTHRVCSPEETWQRIAPLLPRCGITRIADLTRLDRLGIPVFQAVRPASRNLSVAQGKGATSMAARVSAAMEALELWHAECLDHLPTRRASLRAQQATAPIDLHQLPWRQDPARLGAWELDWVEAEPLGDAAPELGPLSLPHTLLELDLSQPEVLDLQPLRRSSNGLASGNCREEALLHAVCELVERDALSAARQGELPRRLLDRSTVDPTLAPLIEQLVRAEAEVALYDLTGPAGIPVIQATLAVPDLPEIWNGSGCHPSPVVAAQRALTEAAQCRLTYIAGVRDDLLRPNDPLSDHLVQGSGAVDGWNLVETFRTQLAAEAATDFTTLEDLAGPSVEVDLSTVLQRLAAQGVRVFAVDLDHPDVGISVVRAISTDLREATYG